MAALGAVYVSPTGFSCSFIGSHRREMPFHNLLVPPCLFQSDIRRHSSMETTRPVHVRGLPPTLSPQG